MMTDCHTKPLGCHVTEPSHDESSVHLKLQAKLKAMLWDIKQAEERLAKALGVWKTPGNPREVRLASAIRLATGFPVRAIPAEFHSRYNELRATATCVPDKGRGRGSIQATADQMDEQAANDLMKGFEALYHDLSAYGLRQG
jgi:hypothetical protein